MLCLRILICVVDVNFQRYTYTPISSSKCHPTLVVLCSVTTVFYFKINKSHVGVVSKSGMSNVLI